MIIHQPHNSAGGYSYNTVIYDGIEYYPHFHRGFEIIYVFSGRIDAVIGGRAMTLKPGDMAICLSNEVHEYKTVGRSHCWITVFSRDFVPEFDRQIKGMVGKDSLVRCDAEILAFLKEKFLKEDTKDHHLISACLHLICGQYLKNTELVPRDGKEFSRIDRIADFITENYKKPISLAETAAALGYDHCYFSKLFKSIFRVGFCDYVNTVRFNAAAKELTNTSRPITEIALDCGFQSIRSFNDIFKKKAGMTPAQYRNRSQSI